MESEGDDNTNDMDDRGNMSDDNLGSCGSVDDAKTPLDDDESLNQSLSPGAFSALSSLQSPSTSLASPLTPNALLHNNNNSNSNNNNHTSNGLNSTNSGGGHIGSAMTSVSASATLTDITLGTLTNTTSSTLPPQSNASQKPLFADSPTICDSTTIAINGSQQTKNHMQHTDNSQIANTTNSTDAAPTEKKIRVQNSDDESHKTTASASLSSSSSTLYPPKGKSSSSGSSDNSHKSIDKSALLLNQSVNHLQHQQYQQKLFLQSQQKHLQQPLPPHAFHFLNQPDLFYEKIIRNPVGANPRDINNPLSINQLTKRDYANSASMALSPSALHHLMGVGASSQGPSSHVPPQLFLSSAATGPAMNSNPSADFHHFSLQQELLNHHQQNALSSRAASQSSPSLNYHSARAFAASMMSAQHPYPHANHPAFSVTPDASVVGVPPPASTSSAASSSRLSEDASGGAISVT